jgi:hypothetical protein
MARTGKRHQRPLAYPEPPVIDESMWTLLAVAINCNPHNAKKIVRDFCTEFHISPQAVEQRMIDDIEAIEERPRATLH